MNTKKTILVSISNAPAYRNLAMFPGSVIDRLSKNENLNIVILLKKGTSYNFSSTAPNAKIIEWPESMYRTLLQNILHFFYSFFIFTDTTQLVSSYGVRSDKPRPFYRYWNYPFKWLISKTFGKIKFLRETLVPRMFFYLYKNHRPYKALIDQIKPDLLFLPNICIWPADLAILAESRRQSIPVVGMPGNWDHLSKYYIPFKPDQLLVWSESVKEEAVRYQFYDPDIVSVVGAPQIDFFYNKASLDLKEDFFDRINFPKTARVLVYASQGPYSLDGPDYVDIILNNIEKSVLPSDLYVIVRPHPHGLGEKERYERFSKHPRVFIDTTEGWSSVEHARHFSNVFGHADVVVTTFSSVATEASIWDRPTIIANFDGYKNRPFHQSVRRHKKFTHFQDVLATGGVYLANNPEELVRSVKRYLDNPTLESEGRSRLRSEIFGFFDGQASKRIYDGIVRHLYGTE